MWKIIIIASLAISYITCQEKESKLVSWLNPGCDSCGNDTTLVYTRADDGVDSVHSVWDTSGGSPALLVARTEPGDNLTIAWLLGKPLSFTWTRPPTYSFAYVINEVWEFEDANDTGSWSPASPTRRHDTARLAWRRALLRRTERDVTLTVRAALGRTAPRGGYLQLDLHTVSSRRSSPRLPHLVVTPNSSLAEVSLVSAGGGRFPHNRLALSLLLVSADPAGRSWQAELLRSLDDEHTPGIFKVWQLRSPGADGFLQFRPVCYTAAAREVAASSVMRPGAPRAAPPPPAASTAARYFAARATADVLTQSVLVVLGGSGDGFYKRTNYTAWATTVGWGAPPVERFSPLVVGVLAAGAGASALLAAAGALALLGRALCGRRRDREALLH